MMAEWSRVLLKKIINKKYIDKKNYKEMKKIMKSGILILNSFSSRGGQCLDTVGQQELAPPGSARARNNKRRAQSHSSRIYQTPTNPRQSSS